MQGVSLKGGPPLGGPLLGDIPSANDWTVNGDDRLNSWTLLREGVEIPFLKVDLTACRDLRYNGVRFHRRYFSHWCDGVPLKALDSQIISESRHSATLPYLKWWEIRGDECSLSICHSRNVR